MEIVIDIDRLWRELDQLATFSDAPAPAVTRVLYSPTDGAGRDYVRGLMEEIGLTIRVDAIGDMFGRWEGSEPGQSAVGTGSHIDAIPYSGKYDGTIGVIGGIEAIRALKRARFTPKRSIEILTFTSEEPTRFGLGCIGSRALAGSVTSDSLRALKDNQGCDFESVRASAGFTGSLDSVRLPTDHYGSWIELHIEQGPLLEQRNIPIGVVTAIAAPAAVSLSFSGEGGHAGAVLMKERRDSLVAAAEFAVAVERIAGELGTPDTVATVGVFTVHPGASNSIPSRVDLTLDVRDIDGSARDRVANAIEAEARAISERRRQELGWRVVNSDPPATCDARLVAAVQKACSIAGHRCQQMVSRAYHDSLFMARIAPTVMIFTPCRGGVSHRPDEYLTPEQLRVGVETLAHTLAIVAAE